MTEGSHLFQLRLRTGFHLNLLLLRFSSNQRRGWASGYRATLLFDEGWGLRDAVVTFSSGKY